jgi:DNA polymerase
MSAKLDQMMKIWDEIQACDKCAIGEYAQNRVFGEENIGSPIVFVGEGPGMEEDKLGRPFMGKAGKILDSTLKAAGFLRERVFIANVVKCHPPKSINPVSGNRKPSKIEMGNCLPFLWRQLEIIKPKLVVAMGRVAAEALLGDRIKDEKMKDIVGQVWELEDKPYNVAISYHPQYLGYREGDNNLKSDYVRFFRELKERVS